MTGRQQAPDHNVPGPAPADRAADGGAPDRPGRGHLRIYIRSTAGVGKTYAMLSEGHRRGNGGDGHAVTPGAAVPRAPLKTNV